MNDSRSDRNPIQEPEQTRPVAIPGMLAAALIVWGGAAVIAQSVLWREAHVVFFGSELSLGIVLASWLIGVSLGGPVGGRLAARRRSPQTWLAGTLLCFAAVDILAVVLLRLCRHWLGLTVGEYVPPGWMLPLSLVLIGPVAFWVGCAFALATASAATHAESGALSIGRIYLLESAGSLAGGVIFTFLLAGKVGSLRCAVLLAGALALAAAAVSISSGRPSRGARRAAVAIALVGGAAAVFAAGPVARLERATILRRWQTYADGLQLVAWTDSKYQHLALGRLEGQYTLYANGQKVTDFPKRYGYERIFAHLMMSQHPRPQNVLMLSGGAEALLAEILLHRTVRHVDYVELDPALLAMLREHLAERDAAALADERVAVHHADPRAFLARSRARYDLIIASLPEPASILVARMFTLQFYRTVSAALSPDGVFVFVTSASPGALRPEARRYLATVYATLKTVFPDVLVEWGTRPHIYAAKRTGVLTTDPKKLAERFGASGVSPEEFPAELLTGTTDALDPAKVARRRSELEATAAPVSTDQNPIVMLRRMIFWHRQQRAAAGLLEAIESMRTSTALAAVLAATALAFLVGSLRGRAGIARLAVAWSIATTGAATMAGELVLLFIYQTLLGYVYEKIAMVIAAFMLGLVLGSGLVNRLIARRKTQRPWRLWLLGLDLLVAAMMVMIYAILPAETRLAMRAGWATELAVYAQVALLGAAGGAMFPLAGQVYISESLSLARASGLLEFADHAGAAAGALLVGVVLLASVGIAGACAVLAASKILSACLLLMAFAIARRRPT